MTQEGVRSALLFVGRVAASVSLAVLLTLTTSWHRLFMALRGLKVPALFVLTVAMAYRYIFLLVGIVTDMHMARKSRTIRYLSPEENSAGWPDGSVTCSENRFR